MGAAPPDLSIDLRSLQCAWKTATAVTPCLFWRVPTVLRTFVTDLTFQSLGVAEPILRALAVENYTHPTPIQAKAIPALLAGRDLLGIAQTGTGKTAAFGLPLLQKLSIGHVRPRPRETKALILAPTRELAIQIEESLKTYGRFLNLKRAVTLGGVSQYAEVNSMRQAGNVLASTRGHLLDFVKQKEPPLGRAAVLFLEAANRIWAMGVIGTERSTVIRVDTDR